MTKLGLMPLKAHRGSEHRHMWTVDPLARGPEHGSDGRACSSLGLAGDLESVTLIERDALGIWGIQIHRQMILVDDREAMLHQFAAEAPSLHGPVDTKPCQVPMRESRVCVVHLAEDGEGVVVLCGRDRLREHGDMALPSTSTRGGSQMATAENSPSCQTVS
jgi:hypothetical protein